MTTVLVEPATPKCQHALVHCQINVAQTVSLRARIIPINRDGTKSSLQILPPQSGLAIAIQAKRWVAYHDTLSGKLFD